MIVLAVLALLAACGSGTPSSGAGPTLAPLSGVATTAPTVSTTATVRPTGFAATTARLTEPDGSVCERCLLLASTIAEHQRGLMGVTSLGGYDGMAFEYAAPSRAAYWMKDTVLPLSIAFYAPTGDRVGAFAMDPCAADPCPSTGPADPFTVAVEVAQGRLDELGFTASARLELLHLPCDPGGAG